MTPFLDGEAQGGQTFFSTVFKLQNNLPVSQMLYGRSSGLYQAPICPTFNFSDLFFS